MRKTINLRYRYSIFRKQTTNKQEIPRYHTNEFTFTAGQTLINSIKFEKHHGLKTKISGLGTIFPGLCTVF
jgi:hypothetical protein